MKRLVLAALLLITPISCARMPLHPGAANSFDSSTYDVLIAAKTTIDTSRQQFAAKTLPDTLKPAANELVRAYDVAYPVYVAYHDAVTAGKPADQKLAELTTDLAVVTKALTAFKGGR